MLVPLWSTLALLAVMAVKHFVADFLCQTTRVARGKAAPRGWLTPLLAHAGGHALITLAIALLLFPHVWWIAGAEFVLHAAIDRAKVLVGNRAHVDMNQSSFWWLLGFDQMLHQLTNIGIVGVFLWSTPV